jgi:uncharacterized protein (DUF885 family)
MLETSPRRSAAFAGAVIAAFAVAACHRHAPHLSTIVHDGAWPSSKLAADAIAGVSNGELRQLLADHWEATMRWDPVYATTLGEHRYDDRLAMADAASLAQRHAERDELLERGRHIAGDRLDAKDRVTLALLTEELAANQASDRCVFEQWQVGAQGLFSELSYVTVAHQVTTPQSAAALIARMKQGPRVIRDTLANLRLGLGAGLVAPAESVRRAVQQLDDSLAQPPESWEMAKPAWTTAAEGATPWPAGERARLAAALRAVVRDELAPAFVELRDLLTHEILPKARPEKEGLAGLPGGDACYQAMIKVHIGLARTPAELHQLGLQEIQRTDRELAALGKKVLGTADLAATLVRLRTDPKLYFSSGPEMMAAAAAALARAKQAIPGFFGVLPKTDCVLREIPAHEAPYSTIAYYRRPNFDGTKPGEYFVNTYKPEVRPRYELEALTWHESIPGHHLQIAIAQELGALPAFRRLSGLTAFVEGWGLYSERLAEDMGLYTSDLDRLGKLSYDAWRASRLVVDTGVHAFGWTRAQAETFMREHTALTFTNISNEVDRYISTPGQALAYKVGQLEILRLRAKAEAELGSKFTLRDFHDVVLGAGAVTLPVLAERVEAWIQARRQRP